MHASQKGQKGLGCGLEVEVANKSSQSNHDNHGFKRAKYKQFLFIESNNEKQLDRCPIGTPANSHTEV